MEGESGGFGEKKNEFEKLFRVLEIPVLVLGYDRRLRFSNSKADEIIQLKARDLGSPVSTLNLPPADLDKMVAQVIQTGVSLEKEVYLPRGHWYSLRIQPYLNENGAQDGVVIFLTDIDLTKRAEERLQRLNETLTAFFQSAPDAVLTVDAEGQIERVNSLAESMFGYPCAELVGKRIETLMPERFRKRHLQNRSEYMFKPRPREMGKGLDLFGRRKDGTEFPMDIMLSPIKTDEGVSVIATLRDITERKQAEKALRSSRDELEIHVYERTIERASQQTAIDKLRQRALEGHGLPALLYETVSIVSQILAVEFCKVLELLPDGQSMLLSAGTGWKKGAVGHAVLSAGFNSQAGLALFSNSPIVVSDLQTETRFHPSQLFLDHGVVSGVSVIIHGRGRPYGALGAHTTRQRDFTGDDVHFLQSVASVLAAAIQRSALEEELLNIIGREQRRIGQDLHDGLCQQLAGIEFRNSVLVQQLADVPAAQNEVAHIGALLRDVTGQARNLARGFSPVQLESNGLMAALEALTANSAKLYDLTCRFDCPRPVLIEDSKVATHLYRIAQQAIGNAIKHGQAKSVIVVLKKQGSEAILSVSDNGCGFTGDTDKMEGMGLRIMEYRAEMISAALTIDSVPGKGTTVTCRFKT